MIGAESVKIVHVRLRDDEILRLQRLMEVGNYGAEDALRRALSTESFIKNELAMGHTILIEDTEGSLRKVEFD